jgi:hypothetical protein
MSEPISMADFRRQLNELQELAGNVKRDLALGGNDGGTHMPNMSHRLTKVEGVVEGLKHGQTQLLVTIGVVSAVLIGVGIFTLTELSTLSTKTEDLSGKVAELPSKISSQLLDISKTLADVIIAAKQQPPPPPVPPNTHQ